MCIIPFHSIEATLEIAGGKGANLARLTRTGFDVPHGFVIATTAYRRFVDANGLQNVIASGLANVSADNAGALDAASDKIRAAFASGAMPADIQTAIVAAYAGLSNIPVAVRSSATAEDLPDMSFAGQQDTYLNIIGVDQVLKAAVDCWSSLWTARAIGYRIRNNVDHDHIALAVVIQEMVMSDVSGVMFTANPLTGLLTESVIDAVFGLGEALVSGQVEPDHFVVDANSGVVRQRTLGAKRVATRARAGGGVENVATDDAVRQTLTDEQIGQLVALGQGIQKVSGGVAQDIEWALSDGRLLILQARAITSLFPVPKLSFDPLIAWFSFGAVQGLVGPLTPLGLDVMRQVSTSAGRLFGVELSVDKFDVFVTAGERVWIKLSDVMHNPLGNRLFGKLLAFIEPSVGQIMGTLATDPHMQAGTGRFKFSTLRRLIAFFIPFIPGIARTVHHPEEARTRFDAAMETILHNAIITPATDRFGRLANIVAFIRSRDAIAGVFPLALRQFLPIFAPAMASLMLLRRLADDETRTLEVTRGLQDNVTTAMDLSLWETAAAIRADAQSRDLFMTNEAAALAQAYLSGQLPPIAQATIGRYMERYGMRGTAEIDFGQPRWREDPAAVLRMLQSYLHINPASAPDAQIARARQSAQDAVDALATQARSRSFGRIREKLVRGAARRIRVLMGARESPKFCIIRMMGTARIALLEVGCEFVDAGTINRADDLAFLTLAELDALAQAGTQRDWKPLIAEHRATYERERRRRQVPRVLVSDGRAFYEGVGAGAVTAESGDTITGNPVSPGVVEGVVHIVFDPRDAQLSPGEILVCPGTDPAWTPLFMAAGGLITEVGGMMTHGSVVAREYGIPAVVGVDHATDRLHNGQRIRLDGTTGRITLLDA